LLASVTCKVIWLPGGLGLYPWPLRRAGRSTGAPKPKTDLPKGTPGVV